MGSRAMDGGASTASDRPRPALEAWAGTLAPAAGFGPVPAAGSPMVDRTAVHSTAVDSTAVSSKGTGGWPPGRADVLRLVRQPFTRRARIDRLYAVTGLLLAVPCFALTVVAIIAGASLSSSLAGMLAGLPLLAAYLLAARQLGRLCRAIAARLLNQRVAPPPPFQPSPGISGWVRASLTDPASWRAVSYLLVKLPVAVLGAVVASLLVLYGLPYATFPLWWELVHQLAAHGVVIHLGPWISWWRLDPVLVAQEVRTLAGSFWLVPAGVAIALAAPWLTTAVNAWDEALIARLLGPASLPQRVRELEQARARAVDDSAARLRRIERDLHDGAQADMVAVAMKLSLAKKKLGSAGGPPAQPDLERVRDLVDAAHRGARQAIAELRDLARGIHPPVLDQGLAAALATLAARSEVPADLVTDLAGRPSAAIETIAYFCAAELLANIAKHSGARHATLEVVHASGRLVLRVADDGAGGARMGPGGGLAGLAGRVSTVDGTLAIASPAGGPTVITVDLPSSV
jgi:signal transduction histidine kinase